MERVVANFREKVRRRLEPLGESPLDPIAGFRFGGDWLSARKRASCLSATDSPSTPTAHTATPIASSQSSARLASLAARTGIANITAHAVWTWTNANSPTPARSPRASRRYRYRPSSRTPARTRRQRWTPRRTPYAAIIAATSQRRARLPRLVTIREWLSLNANPHRVSTLVDYFNP